MKIINQPVDTIAIFEASKNKIIPYKFKYNDQAVRIDTVDKVYEEKLAGNRRLVFVCTNKGYIRYELKYEIDTCLWYLFKA
ncbi:hypothetical protein [Abyssisolibacter fermentans]|uniref:hypothetical protein n=1 Tax=Abyssisolibacter fermentans TaxID=1766203 RepID=UPI00082DF11F|nr:hypothetical protein [Abyssisolibacter fermentans]